MTNVELSVPEFEDLFLDWMPYHPGEIVLDKYRIEALIGQGAFGEVYRVTLLACKYRAH